MLSQKTIDIVKSTVPVLEKHGVDITKHFYKRMFTNHPELKNIFNQTNQREGRQPQALAASVYAAAANIDHLESILPVVHLIAHKHRALGILPEHYPIVGENLLAAIKEVLGDAATDEIIEAWADAYGVIADVFIQVEEELYQQAEANGGWRLFKPFKVVKKEQENDLVTSFYLAPEDGKALPPYQPGQYITVKVKAPGEEYTALRHYTISHAPNGNVYRISVKREAENNPKGVVSNYLHDFVEEGSTVEVSAPAGLFTLQQNSNPVLFIGGGIGVTPLYAMLDSMEPGREAAFIQSVRNEKLAVFQEQIQKKINELNGTYLVKYSDTEGHLTKEDLSKFIQENTEVYICGPEAFMEALIPTIRELGVPDERIHFEFFGPGLSFKA
ncbi:MAG: NO-inducible flavohemoprotein [Bacilli bacterium]|jgi:nitric oxide dioxygenase|uniref:nitric oxide dioxygenase n=1 Tax=Ureibacillus suwonensis TaxID=313007 RepID=A0ABW0RAD0_9BACL|nr:NO-inducible flavohemoprotein [Bacilli bacterium]